MFRLDGKVAVVTGAGSGIGAAIGATLAKAGALVFATDINEAAAQATAASIRDAGGKADGVRLDVTDASACEHAGTAIAARAGVDILVNNAGIGHVGTMLTTTGDDLDRLYAVNVRGVFNVSRVFLRGMIARGTGSIINMASVGGTVGIRDRLAYCTTKFAVVGLTKSMALDHAAQGVRVNCICPARVETPFVTARLREYSEPQEAYRQMSASQAVGRMGRPDEIAAAALYLASDEAAFVTGSALMIDGGWTG